MKVFLRFGAVLLTVLILSGCVAEKPPANGPGHDTDEIISLVGLGEEPISFKLETLKALPRVTGTAISISSGGNENQVTYSGVSIDILLDSLNFSRGDFAFMIANAGDGYSVEILPEIWAERDIILALEIDGKSLSEKDGPVRLVIPGERALYWARNVVELVFTANTGTASISEIAFFENILGALTQEIYTYYGSEDLAVNIRELVGSNNRIILLAQDGLLKNENLHSELDYFVKYSGEDAPLFISPSIPKGMYVKDIAVLITGTRAIVFAEQLAVDGQLSMAVVLDLLAPYLSQEQVKLVLATGEQGLSKAQLADKTLTVQDGVYD